MSLFSRAQLPQNDTLHDQKTRFLQSMGQINSYLHYQFTHQLFFIIDQINSLLC